MYKIFFVVSLVFGLFLMAQRDPFSFESSYAIQESEVIKAENNSPEKSEKPDSADKKFVAGNKFDENWTIKSVNDQILILQNAKGQICQISLGISSEKKSEK